MLSTNQKSSNVAKARRMLLKGCCSSCVRIWVCARVCMNETCVRGQQVPFVLPRNLSTWNLSVEPDPLLPPSCCFEVTPQMLHSSFSLSLTQTDAPDDKRHCSVFTWNGIKKVSHNFPSPFHCYEIAVEHNTFSLCCIILMRLR